MEADIIGIVIGAVLILGIGKLFGEDPHDEGYL